MLDLATTLDARYRVESRLGGGGMADVFEAYDTTLNRPVAVKVLRGIDDPAAARRFATEIRLTARLAHPNVVRLFDAGEHDGSPYLVLERVTGGTLAQIMATGPIPARRLAAIGAQLAAALAYAHEQGVVHRDVKPSNVLLADDETVRLADFGIALTATMTRLTVAGQVAGSAGYVSPEQVMGSGAGFASDVYALGLVLLESLTGEPAWSGTTVEVALARITADPPIPSTLPEGWQALLTAMTARDPQQRPPMAFVAEALSALAVGRPPLLPVVPVVPVAPAAGRPSRRVPAVAVAAVVALLGAGVAGLLTGPRAADANTATDAALVADSAITGAAAAASEMPQAKLVEDAADKRRPKRKDAPARDARGDRQEEPRQRESRPEPREKPQRRDAREPQAPFASDVAEELPVDDTTAAAKGTVEDAVSDVRDVIDGATSNPVDEVTDDVAESLPVEEIEDEPAKAERGPAWLRNPLKPGKAPKSDKD